MYLLNGNEHCKCQSDMYYSKFSLTVTRMVGNIAWERKKQRYRQKKVLKNFHAHHTEGHWKVQWEVGSASMKLNFNFQMGEVCFGGEGSLNQTPYRQSVDIFSGATHSLDIFIFMKKACCMVFFYPVPEAWHKMILGMQFVDVMLDMR